MMLAAVMLLGLLKSLHIIGHGEAMTWCARHKPELQQFLPDSTAAALLNTVTGTNASLGNPCTGKPEQRATGPGGRLTSQVIIMICCFARYAPERTCAYTVIPCTVEKLIQGAPTS